MTRADDLLKRLISFAVSTEALCKRLPKEPTATHIFRQLLRCGTAVAPNYAEARSAESMRDFIHKMGIVLKELNESLVWLKMIGEMRLIDPRVVDPLARECDELCRIVYASIRTASGKGVQRSRG
jgi:four helix bundle protein